MATVPRRTAMVPHPSLPILYFGFAHLSLLAAAAVAIVDPASIAGFYYHPRLIGVVHLVTLGWITGSILGALFIVGPLSLRMPMPVRRLDLWAYAVFTIGVAGLVSHFWIEQFSGMVWSAGMVLAAVVQVAVRVVRALPATGLPAAVTAHIGLALLNLVGAASLGVLIGLDREVDVIPGSSLANVYAHAHLAAVGWATMMVVGVGYRLLPMVLPAAMPAGRRVAATAWLLEMGVLGVVVTLLLGVSPALPALLVGAGLCVFLANVRWMHSHRRRRPPSLPRPDWGVRQVMQALAYLGVAMALGLWLAVAPETAASARVATGYGVVGLVGFLSQIVVGVEARLLPLFAWHTGVAASGFTRVPAAPGTMGSQRLQGTTVVLWGFAVPLLAVGLSVEWTDAVRLGGLALAAAVLAQTAVAWRTLRAGRMPVRAAETAGRRERPPGGRTVRTGRRPTTPIARRGPTG